MDQPMPMLLVVKCKLQVKEKPDIFYLRLMGKELIELSLIKEDLTTSITKQ